MLSSPYFCLLRVLTISHGAQQSWQTKQMISMQMCDEDLGDLPWLDTAPLDLNLRTFSTVEYPHTPII